MTSKYHFKIYFSTDEIPLNWDILAVKNSFLSTDYFKILEQSAPENMHCFFIGIFDENNLIGICLAQFINLNKLSSFGERDKCLKKYFRNFIFKNFSSHVLFIGNNMFTGQNAFVFEVKIDFPQAMETLKQATEAVENEIKHKFKKIHITVYKDFEENDLSIFKSDSYKLFSISQSQPNMIFKIDENWKSEGDYINALSKKYRDQYKRSHKKAENIEKRKMNLNEIVKNEVEIYNLYFNVAKNAPFNTFFLAKNHFSKFKEFLKDHFLFYGYFLDDKLIAFNTLIKNGDTMETYFLGYDEAIQREKMLYLNMLYDMINYSIKKGFKKIIFARTALEIKSSVGAKPQKMYGLIKHHNSFINKFIPKIVDFLEPKVLWNERDPFK